MDFFIILLSRNPMRQRRGYARQWTNHKNILKNSGAAPAARRKALRKYRASPASKRANGAV